MSSFENIQFNHLNIIQWWGPIMKVAAIQMKAVLGDVKTNSAVAQGLAEFNRSPF